MTRWFSAIALLDFWRYTAQAAALDSAPRLAMIGKGILGTRALPNWSLGIDQDNRLVLCVERLDKPCWRLAARQSKSERQATSGAGPVPDGLRDGMRHRLLAGTAKALVCHFPVATGALRWSRFRGPVLGSASGCHGGLAEPCRAQPEVRG